MSKKSFDTLLKTKKINEIASELNITEEQVQIKAGKLFSKLREADKQNTPNKLAAEYGMTVMNIINFINKSNGYTNSGERFTPTEVKKLIESVNRKDSIEKISKDFKRTPGAMKAAISKIVDSFSDKDKIKQLYNIENKVQQTPNTQKITINKYSTGTFKIGNVTIIITQNNITVYINKEST